MKRVRSNKSPKAETFRLPPDTQRFLEAIDKAAQEKRDEYRAALAQIVTEPQSKQPELWLTYFSRHMERHGDQEAVVWLRSRKHTCADQVDEIVARWRSDESKAFALGDGGSSSFDVATGRREDSPPKPIDRNADIRKLSRFMLHDFWYPVGNQQFTIDATMLRTADWCEIGGFDEWWERLAKEAWENALHGGVEPIPASYYLFAMCRSDSGRRLINRSLLHILDAIRSCWRVRHTGVENVRSNSGRPWVSWHGLAARLRQRCRFCERVA